MSHFSTKTSGFLGLFLSLLVIPAWGATSHKDFFKEPFKTGPEVTSACLECHDEAAADFMKTSHWNLALKQMINGKLVEVGKRNVFNNFCTQTLTNEPVCHRCHAGYGYVDSSFDFSNKSNIDCLVCHDTTGTYLKGEPAGAPHVSVDLLRVAQSVGKPVRDNCASCHFYGGGGDAVKHGDLDSSMSYPEKSVDVHMAVDGQDFPCQQCHVTKNHVIPGNSLGISPGGANQLRCEDCHTVAPHKESRLNAHVAALACQTCHIPYYAKEIPTKVWWDWSTSGDSERNVVKDKFGHPLYVKKKGDMKYDKMIAPEYAWFETGKAVNYVRGQIIEDPSKILTVAGPTSTIKDDKARIYPFKVMRGKQPYDAKNNYLLVVHQVGDDGYWNTYDWEKAAAIGMKAAGLPFSGQVGFVETKMYWRLNHQVSAKDKSLGCLDCHGDKGRMDWKTLGYQGDPMLNSKWSRKK